MTESTFTSMKHQGNLELCFETISTNTTPTGHTPRLTGNTLLNFTWTIKSMLLPHKSKKTGRSITYILTSCVLTKGGIIFSGAASIYCSRHMQAGRRLSLCRPKTSVEMEKTPGNTQDTYLICTGIICPMV